MGTLYRLQEGGVIHPGDEQFVGVFSFTGTRHRLHEGVYRIPEIQLAISNE